MNIWTRTKINNKIWIDIWNETEFFYINLILEIKYNVIFKNSIS